MRRAEFWRLVEGGGACRPDAEDGEAVVWIVVERGRHISFAALADVGSVNGGVARLGSDASLTTAMARCDRWLAATHEFEDEVEFIEPAAPAEVA